MFVKSEFWFTIQKEGGMSLKLYLVIYLYLSIYQTIYLPIHSCILLYLTIYLQNIYLPIHLSIFWTLQVKTDVLETKNLLLQEKEERIQSLEGDNKQREQLRMKEMDVLINLRWLIDRCTYIQIFRQTYGLRYRQIDK